MIGIDTNILLRWLIDDSIWPDDNPGQTDAVSNLLNDDNQRFFVNSMVLHETLWILTKPFKQPKRVIIDILDRLLASSNVELQNREAVQAAMRSFSALKSGVHDRLIAEINTHSGCRTTFTFDKEAARTPGFELLKSKR